MSKTKNNVHRGYYTMAGRERQGEDVIHDRQKAWLTQSRAGLEPAPPFTGWPALHVESRSEEGEENLTPDEETLERDRRDEEQVKSPSTQAGEFVRELPRRGSKRLRQQAARAAGRGRRDVRRRPSARRSRARAALKREDRSAASRPALARRARARGGEDGPVATDASRPPDPAAGPRS